MNLVNRLKINRKRYINKIKIIMILNYFIGIISFSLIFDIVLSEIGITD